MDLRHQHRVWETIFESFDETRQEPWPFVQPFVDQLAPGARVLDLMAGNGRHGALAAAAGHDTVWLDWSRPAAKAVSQRLPQMQGLVADAIRLPLADDSFDAVLYVAGLHGIPRPEDRAHSLDEVRRVLRPDGRLLLSVWNRHAPRFQNIFGNGPVDLHVPWRAGGHDEVRTYHLYTQEALQAELQAAGLQPYDVELGSADPQNIILAATPGP